MINVDDRVTYISIITRKISFTKYIIQNVQIAAGNSSLKTKNNTLYNLHI